MQIKNILPENIDWNNVDEVKTESASGFSLSKTKKFNDITLRKIIYSENYLADHWCDKGHIIFIIEGELIIQYKNESQAILTKNMNCIIGDNSLAHKAKSINGATVLIID